MTAWVELQARSVAASLKSLRDLEPFEGKRVYALAEVAGSTPWALLEVTGSGGGRFAVFPLDAGGRRGDTSKQGQAGVRVSPAGIHSVEHTWQVVVNRSRRMVAARPVAPLG